MSGARFASGKVAATVTLPEEVLGTYGLFLLGFSSWDSRCFLVGLSGYGPAFTLLEHLGGSNLRTLGESGAAANLEGNTPYNLEVRVDGQTVILNVDGIKVLERVIPEPLKYEQVGLYAQGVGPIRFESVSVSTKESSAFVVMQFGSPYDELYNDVIREVCREYNLNVIRADDIYRPGVIFQDILQGLDEANVVIADVTPPNPNVFFELGYSHALKKPAILLAERNTTLPFDISGYRVIFYDNTIGGKTAVEADLRRYLNGISGE